MADNRKIPFRLTSRISGFDRALSEDISSVFIEQRKAFMPSDNVLGYTHGTKWHARSAETKDDNEVNEMQTHSMQVEIPFQEIIDNELDVLARYRDELVSGMMQELMSVMYQTISESANKTGNVVGSKGGVFKAEQFVEMLEKIEFGVGRDGKVSFPEIHAGPELAEKMTREISAQGPEFEKRIQEITEKKTKAALEKENERKSKFPNHDDD